MGPGGFADALRTVPALADTWDRLAARAADAFIINLTNPSGIVTQAATIHTGLRFVSVCDGPVTFVEGIARATGRDAAAIRLDYAGMNHCGFWVDPQADVLVSALPATSGADAADVETLQALPTPYVRFYLHPDRQLESQLASEESRAHALKRMEARHARAVRQPCRVRGQQTRRRALWYGVSIAPLVDAIVDGGDDTVILVCPTRAPMPWVPRRHNDGVAGARRGGRCAAPAGCRGCRPGGPARRRRHPFETLTARALAGSQSRVPARSPAGARGGAGRKPHGRDGGAGGAAGGEDLCQLAVLRRVDGRRAPSQRWSDGLQAAPRASGCTRVGTRCRRHQDHRGGRRRHAHRRPAAASATGHLRHATRSSPEAFLCALGEAADRVLPAGAHPVAIGIGVPGPLRIRGPASWSSPRTWAGGISRWRLSSRSASVACRRSSRTTLTAAPWRGHRWRRSRGGPFRLPCARDRPGIWCHRGRARRSPGHTARLGKWATWPSTTGKARTATAGGTTAWKPGAPASAWRGVPAKPGRPRACRMARRLRGTPPPSSPWPARPMPTRLPW